MRHKATAIIINDKDNVATALTDLHAGREIPLTVQGKEQHLQLLTDIPAGHKFALTEIERGSDIIKYGEPIGQSTAKIKRGSHVHTHNMRSPKSRTAG